MMTAYKGMEICVCERKRRRPSPLWHLSYFHCRLSYDYTICGQCPRNNLYSTYSGKFNALRELYCVTINVCSSRHWPSPGSHSHIASVLCVFIIGMTTRLITALKSKKRSRYFLMIDFSFLILHARSHCTILKYKIKFISLSVSPWLWTNDKTLNRNDLTI